MAKEKEESGAAVRVDREYPSQILYSSPPEASTLNNWVRDVEQKRAAEGNLSKDHQK